MNGHGDGRSSNASTDGEWKFSWLSYPALTRAFVWRARATFFSLHASGTPVHTAVKETVEQRHRLRYLSSLDAYFACSGEVKILRARYSRRQPM